MKKLFVKSYGCQMNVYDAARMADVMAAEGYAETTDAADADLVILNTCHIREKAVEKVYSELGRLREMKAERRAAGGADLKVVRDSTWSPGVNVRAGVEVGRPTEGAVPGRRWSVLGEFYDGPSPYGQFHRDAVRLAGVGFHFTL